MFWRQFLLQLEIYWILTNGLLQQFGVGYYPKVTYPIAYQKIGIPVIVKYTESSHNNETFVLQKTTLTHFRFDSYRNTPVTWIAIGF